jgi:hypothetical protein
MKSIKTLIFLLALSLGPLNQSFAQENCSLQLGTDLMSRYVWRGLDLGGASPSIQPTLAVNWSSKDTTHTLKLGLWGAYTLGPTANQELDLFLTYSFKEMLSFTLTDYFFPGLNTGTKDQYFVYNSDSTGHVMEASIAFNGTDKIPFTLLFAANFYGNDALKLDAGGLSTGIAFSKYLELGYKRTIHDVDMNIFLGVALDDPDESLGETAFYLNEKAGFINIGLKLIREIEITEEFTLPVQCSFAVNPQANRAYLTFGITL